MTVKHGPRLSAWDGFPPVTMLSLCQNKKAALSQHLGNVMKNHPLLPESPSLADSGEAAIYRITKDRGPSPEEAHGPGSLVRGDPEYRKGLPMTGTDFTMLGGPR